MSFAGNGLEAVAADGFDEKKAAAQMQKTVEETLRNVCPRPPQVRTLKTSSAPFNLTMRIKWSFDPLVEKEEQPGSHPKGEV